MGKLEVEVSHGFFLILPRLRAVAPLCPSQKRIVFKQLATDGRFGAELGFCGVLI